jgi:hypothetical protein
MALKQLAMMSRQRCCRRLRRAALSDSVIVFIATGEGGRSRLMTERLKQGKIRVKA